MIVIYYKIECFGIKNQMLFKLLFEISYQYNVDMKGISCNILKEFMNNLRLNTESLQKVRYSK